MLTLCLTFTSCAQAFRTAFRVSMDCSQKAYKLLTPRMTGSQAARLNNLEVQRENAIDGRKLLQISSIAGNGVLVARRVVFCG